MTLAQELDPAAVARRLGMAARRWREYTGPRDFTLDQLTFVQGTAESWMGRSGKPANSLGRVAGLHNRSITSQSNIFNWPSSPAFFPGRRRSGLPITPSTSTSASAARGRRSR